MLTAATLFVHLVGFAAYIGAGFAQTQFMKASAKAEVAPELRAAYERLADAIVTKAELPALMGSIVSGMVFVAMTPAFLRQGWLHGKLTCVLVLAVLSHLEMFNARKIVRARAAGGPGVEEEIAGRKKKHAAMGSVGALAVVALLVLVTFARLGALG